MSGTIALPDSITIAEADAGIEISIEAAPAPPDYNPLANDPSQNWVLQTINGVATWVQTTAVPTDVLFGDEDGGDVLLMEDGQGAVILEP
jgi:hypothetical protein